MQMYQENFGTGIEFYNRGIKQSIWAHDEFGI